MKLSQKTLLVISSVALVIIAIVFAATRTPFEKRRPMAGDPAPALHLADTSGRMVSLAEYKGKVVLVNFWAPWCPPCVEELGWFEKLAVRYKDSGFAVVAVSTAQVGPEEARRLGVTFPVLVANERVKNDYGDISDVPVSFLIGPDGTVIKKIRQTYAEDALRADVEDALMGKK